MQTGSLSLNKFHVDLILLWVPKYAGNAVVLLFLDDILISKIWLCQFSVLVILFQSSKRKQTIFRLLIFFFLC